MCRRLCARLPRTEDGDGNGVLCCQELRRGRHQRAPVQLRDQLGGGAGPAADLAPAAPHHLRPREPHLARPLLQHHRHPLHRHRRRHWPQGTTVTAAEQLIYIECLNWLVGVQDPVPALQPPGWLECAGRAQATEEAVSADPPLQPPGHQEVLQTHCHRKPSPLEITGLLSHIRGRKGCHKVGNNGKIHQIGSIHPIPKFYWQCNSI